MHRLMYAGLPLPEIYVCRNAGEARKISDAGIPYLITNRNDKDIIKIILYRTLRAKFPYIDWTDVLDISGYETEVLYVPGSDDGEAAARSDEGDEELSDGDGMRDTADIATDRRVFECDGIRYDNKEVDLAAYCADASSHVNIEQLQDLGMLPKFMSDAADAIRSNIEDRIKWRECYNKRLGSCIGEFDYSLEAPNLIILDISGSIPRGISATMLELIDTLRDQANADLIITGSTSMFWSSEDELPDPRKIRSMIGCSNECTEFFRILRENIAGRHFGNVISFGDYDEPAYYNIKSFSGEIYETEVDRVIHYHTMDNDETGYARWCKMVSPGCEEEFNCTWCDVMMNR